jgi:hypothetical protein
VSPQTNNPLMLVIEPGSSQTSLQGAGPSPYVPDNVDWIVDASRVYQPSLSRELHYSTRGSTVGSDALLAQANLCADCTAVSAFHIHVRFSRAVVQYVSILADSPHVSCEKANSNPCEQPMQLFVNPSNIDNAWLSQRFIREDPILSPATSFPSSTKTGGECDPAINCQLILCGCSNFEIR